MAFNKKHQYALYNNGRLYESTAIINRNNSYMSCYYEYLSIYSIIEEALYLHLLYKRGYCNLKDLELIDSEDIIVRQMLFQYLKNKYERIKKLRKEKRSIKKS